MQNLFADDAREPLRRLLREKGFRQERGRRGAPLPYWSEPGTGYLFSEDELAERFRGEVGGD